MRRPSSVIPYMAALVLALACGDAGEQADEMPADSQNVPVMADENAPQSMPAARDSSRPAGSLGDPADAAQVGARLSEFAIALSPDTVEAGEVTINIDNRGERSHTIEVRHATQGRWRTIPIPPGGTVGLSMPLPAGTYEVVSTDADYVARGMRATLIVR